MVPARRAPYSVAMQRYLLKRCGPRVGEFGIRKVLAAAVPALFRLLSTEFIRLRVLANIIAWPIASFIRNSWLQAFAYRIDPGLSTFILAVTLWLGITLLTVSYQAVKVAVHKLK